MTGKNASTGIDWIISKSGKKTFSIVLFRVMSRERGIETTSASKKAINNLTKVKAKAVRTYIRSLCDKDIWGVWTTKNKIIKVATKATNGIKTAE